MIYADTGINWIFVYRVEYEDDCILVLRDLGRYHKFDEDRSWGKPVDKWVEIVGNTWACIDGKLKLVEIKPE